MRTYRLLLAFDAVVAAVVLLIFGIGLVQAIEVWHVDREDLLLWPPILIVLTATLWGGMSLKARGRLDAARGVLLIVAIPGAIAALGMLYLISELMRPGAWR